VNGRRLDAGLALSSTVGFLLGGVSATAAYALYPPSRENPWPIPTVAAVSVLSMLALYAAAARLGVVRVGDWFVVGYTLALVLAACVVVTREVVEAVRIRVPEAIGVKTVAVGVRRTT